MAPKSKPVPISEPAPWYTIPEQRFISVEHPCVVKNVEKGVEMIGGSKGIREALDQDQPDRPVSLSLHPEDRAARTITSINCQTNNLLLKITVPKRTGRKRKRGSDDAFEEDQSLSDCRKDARYMLRSLQDNTLNSDIDIIGTIDRTHVFRSMPDFTYSVADHQLMNEVKSKILLSNTRSSRH